MFQVKGENKPKEAVDDVRVEDEVRPAETNGSKNGKADEEDTVKPEIMTQQISESTSYFRSLKQRLFYNTCYFRT
jgi:hypothetical protein